MIGRVIEDDLFGVCRRLKSIDDGYYVFRNYKTGKFEVHNSKDKNTLCLVLPYDTLDERTVRHVLYTRADRLEQNLKIMDEQNRKAEERERKNAIVRALAAVGG
ncbi:MAG: hypothetical protein HDT28_05105 [Clostridiales bacterium]|nr:hypothetical protein [Clostridiales bacterium]